MVADGSGDGNMMTMLKSAMKEVLGRDRPTSHSIDNMIILVIAFGWKDICNVCSVCGPMGRISVLVDFVDLVAFRKRGRSKDLCEFSPAAYVIAECHLIQPKQNYQEHFYGKLYIYFCFLQKLFSTKPGYE